VILVKLWQFDHDDRTYVTIDTNQQRFIDCPDRPGVRQLELFHDDREAVRLEHWNANANVKLASPYGLEVFVMQGSFVESGELFQRDSWLRLPARSGLLAQTGADGCRIWLKLGQISCGDFR
jgi:hypothetical protein